MRTLPPLKQLLLAALLAGGMTMPVLAQVNINISLAPPPPPQEVVPALAPDRVWAPGYWAWNGDRHVWVKGKAIVRRDGYRWAPDHWEKRDNGYYRQAGYWVRDANYVKVKEKKAKKHKHGHDDDDDDDHGGHGKHGKNGKHGKGHHKD